MVGCVGRNAIGPKLTKVEFLIFSQPSTSQPRMKLGISPLLSHSEYEIGDPFFCGFSVEKRGYIFSNLQNNFRAVRFLSFSCWTSVWMET
jgi:hypothetical protein